MSYSADILTICKRARDEIHTLKELLGRPQCAICKAFFEDVYAFEYHAFRAH